VPKSIAVFGAGPGLGQSVARRFKSEGYDVVLVARSRQHLDVLAQDLADLGVKVNVVTGDLADIDVIPDLAKRVRDVVGDLDVLYFAPTPDQGFVAATKLTAQRAQDFMPLIFLSLISLVQEFLPRMIERGSGAIMSAQGASTTHGLAYLSGSGPAQAAQRNYLESLQAEVAEKGVYVGMLYIGALIENSAFHSEVQEAKAAGTGRDWGPTVNPIHLADLLWDMLKTKKLAATIYP
jgi:short-subunit dehydrogenase